MGWYDNVSNLKTLLLHQLIINSWEKKNRVNILAGNLKIIGFQEVVVWYQTKKNYFIELEVARIF